MQNPESMANDLFGYGIALDRGRMLVGAPGRDHNGLLNSGSAYAYEPGILFGQPVWWLRQTLPPVFFPAVGIACGTAVAASGGEAAVGAPLATVSGAVSAGYVTAYQADRLFADGFGGD